MGKLGLQVQAETENFIRDLRLRERFGSKDERTKFQLDQERSGAPDDSRAGPNARDSGDDGSEDDIPKHAVPYHGEGDAAEEEPRPHPALKTQPTYANEIFEEDEEAE